jgi:hypothetical protein
LPSSELGTTNRDATKEDCEITYANKRLLKEASVPASRFGYGFPSEIANETWNAGINYPHRRVVTRKQTTRYRETWRRYELRRQTQSDTSDPRTNGGIPAMNPTSLLYVSLQTPSQMPAMMNGTNAATVFPRLCGELTRVNGAVGFETFAEALV